MRLTTRQLNRTFLDRQHMLERADSVGAAMRTHVAVQAQEAPPQFVALWSRVVDFTPDRLTALMQRRELVRASTLRNTIHLHTVEDYLMVWSVLGPEYRESTRDFLEDHPDPSWTDEARQHLQGRALNGPGLEAALVELLGEYEPGTFRSNYIRASLGLVRVAPDGGASRGPRDLWTPAEAWLRLASIDGPPQLGELARRYLSGYGPATVYDLASWAGIRVGLAREAFELIEPELVWYDTEDGGRLADLDTNGLLTGDEPAPPRLVAAFDNLFLGHADRSRVVDEHLRSIVMAPFGRGVPGLLVDGRVAGSFDLRWEEGWEIVLRPVVPVTDGDIDGLAEEGRALVAALHGETARISVDRQ